MVTARQKAIGNLLQLFLNSSQSNLRGSFAKNCRYFSKKLVTFLKTFFDIRMNTPRKFQREGEKGRERVTETGRERDRERDSEKERQKQ